MNPIKILLADDHQLLRAGIRSLVERMPGVEVVAEASTGAEALKLTVDSHPDIVLMDIAMAEMNGLDATETLLKENPETRVIILSVHTNEEYVYQALRVGASGYLLKSASPTELQLAIEAVHKGDTYLSPSISRLVIGNCLIRVGGSKGMADDLTPRQREILQLIAEGKNTKEIAFLLNLSAKTVETHRTRMMEKLNIRDIAGLVRFALKAGLAGPVN